MGGKNRKGRLVRRRGGKQLRVRREKGMERKRVIEQRVRRRGGGDGWEEQEGKIGEKKWRERVEGEKGERD
jgi:hypothetical protein